jgi:hypothetical protein
MEQASIQMAMRYCSPLGGNKNTLPLKNSNSSERTGVISAAAVEQSQRVTTVGRVN